MQTSPKLDQNTEFECKYRVEQNVQPMFKKLVEQLSDIQAFLYVEGPDCYYSHPDFDDSSFGRYRRPSFGLDGGRAEWTVKFKPKGAKNSIQRLEINWRVDKTPEEDIKRGVELMGFKPNFVITKNCHIYKFEDATLVYYTVYDITGGETSNRVDHFVEIEVSEEKISKEGLTEAEAWGIIEKYEKILSPLGITPQKRMRRSLWEMYRR
jgi:adenylate cyclase class IV